MGAIDGTCQLEVLLLEDEEVDALIVRRQLSDAHVTWARTAEEGLSAARTRRFDAAVVDLHLPGSDTDNTVRGMMRAMGTQGPVLILTGVEDDEVASRWVREGVDDFISKPELARSLLARRVAMSVQRHQMRRASLSWEERIADWARAGEYDFEWDLRVNRIAYSPSWRRLIGLDEAEASTEAWFTRVHPDDQLLLCQAIMGIVEQGRPGAEHRHRMRVASGNYRWFSLRMAACMDGTSQPTRVLGSHSDVTGECENPCHACGTDNTGAAAECLGCGAVLETADALAPTMAEAGGGGRHGWTGRIVAGRFVIGRNIGAGGAGAVYLAHDKVDNHTVAIKLLHPWLLESREARDRFLAEGDTQRNLDHPNLVRVVDVGHAGGVYYIATEFAADGSLLDLLRGRERLDEERALEMFVPLIRGVACAHDHGIVHRDIKPANILMGREDGRLVAKLTDFGVAKLAPQHSITHTGAVIGTLRYMAPEQFRDAKSVDERADIYALAATLHQVITGRVPHGAHLPAAEGVVVAVTSAAVRTSRPVAAVLARCLAPTPADRPSSCHEMADLLAAGLAQLRRVAEASRSSAR